MRKALFQIAPLDCPGCGKKVEDNLLNQSGVRAVDVFPRFGRIRTEFDETETSAEQLKAIISSLGYVVEFKK